MPPRIGFLAGFGSAWRGARFVYREHPGLARLWVPPVLITAAGIVGVLWLVAHYHGVAVEAVWAMPRGGTLGASVLRGVHRVVEALAAFVVGAIGVVAVALCGSVIAAPWNDALSEEVERLHTGRDGPRTGLGVIVRDLGRAIGLGLTKLALYALGMGVLVAVGIVVPGAGALLYPTLGFAFTALFLAIDYMDWPACRRGLPGRARVAFALAHLRPSLGLGVGLWLLLFVPLLDLLFMPAAVAGATLLFVDLENEARAAHPDGR